MSNPYQRKLILLGLMSSQSDQPEEKANLFDAAAELLSASAHSDHDLATECRALAQCIRETESAQLRLFENIKSSAQ